MTTASGEKLQYEGLGVQSGSGNNRGRELLVLVVNTRPR